MLSDLERLEQRLVAVKALAVQAGGSPWNVHHAEIDHLHQQIAEVTFRQRLDTLSPLHRLVAERLWQEGLYTAEGRESCEELEQIVLDLCVHAQQLGDGSPDEHV